MRVDVFLRAARLVKRRSLAKELCDEGAVVVNGRTARAGREVRAGDELGLNLRNRRLRVEVVAVPERAPRASEARELYSVVSDERIREEDEV